MAKVFYNTRWMRVLVGMALCLPAWAADGIRTSVDWSHQHLVITNQASLQQRMAAAQDPRAVSNWLRRSQALAAARAVNTQPRVRGQHRRSMDRDWSVSLGAGRVAPGMSPAKFGISISATPSCTSDYMVYGLDFAATTNTPGGQANLVGLRNLYSGGTGGSLGACGQVNVSGEFRIGNTVTITTSTAHSFTTGAQVVLVGLSDAGANGTWTVTGVPGPTAFTYTTTGLTGLGFASTGTAAYAAATVAFAYNITTSSGGRILTSPSISLDGARIMFVESTPTSSIFHVLTLDPCVTSATGCTTNGTSATGSAVPGNGNAASMVSITYSSSSNTLSSPWIDYQGNGTAYVGDDGGKLYRINNVLHGTPAVDATFGGSGSVTVSSGVALLPPVLAQGWLLVGNVNGTLRAVQASSPYTVAVSTVNVGTGMVDAPVVDASTTGTLSAFITSSSGFTLAQAVFDIASQTFTTRTATIGHSSSFNAHAPALDNNYYLGVIDATHGFIYACGTLAGSQHPTLYRLGFTAGSPPALNTASASTANISNNNGECSPMTEFANPNLSVSDLLFVGDSTGAVRSFNISGAMPSAPLATATEPGGTSGIIVDNTSTVPQASSIYFSTQSNVGGNCGSGNYCAIKLTQATLQ